MKDDDDRLPIHWAVAYNHLPIVELLVATKDFDPDVEVHSSSTHVLELNSPLTPNRTGHVGPL
jgi:26S proteasome non-ATPase regulatory subunit 10